MRINLLQPLFCTAVKAAMTKYPTVVDIQCKGASFAADVASLYVTTAVVKASASMPSPFLPPSTAAAPPPSSSSSSSSSSKSGSKAAKAAARGVAVAAAAAAAASGGAGALSLSSPSVAAAAAVAAALPASLVSAATTCLVPLLTPVIAALVAFPDNAELVASGFRLCGALPPVGVDAMPSDAIAPPARTALTRHATNLTIVRAVVQWLATSMLLTAAAAAAVLPSTPPPSSSSTTSGSGSGGSKGKASSSSSSPSSTGSKASSLPSAASAADAIVRAMTTWGPLVRTALAAFPGDEALWCHALSLAEALASAPGNCDTLLSWNEVVFKAMAAMTTSVRVQEMAMRLLVTLARARPEQWPAFKPLFSGSLLHDVCLAQLASSAPVVQASLTLVAALAASRPHSGLVRVVTGVLRPVATALGANASVMTSAMVALALLCGPVKYERTLVGLVDVVVETLEVHGPRASTSSAAPSSTASSSGSGSRAVSSPVSSPPSSAAAVSSGVAASGLSSESVSALSLLSLTPSRGTATAGALLALGRLFSAYPGLRRTTLPVQALVTDAVVAAPDSASVQRDGLLVLAYLACAPGPRSELCTAALLDASTGALTRHGDDAGVARSALLFLTAVGPCMSGLALSTLAAMAEVVAAAVATHKGDATVSQQGMAMLTFLRAKVLRANLRRSRAV